MALYRYFISGNPTAHRLVALNPSAALRELETLGIKPVRMQVCIDRGLRRLFGKILGERWVDVPVEAPTVPTVVSPRVVRSTLGSANFQERSAKVIPLESAAWSPPQLPVMPTEQMNGVIGLPSNDEPANRIEQALKEAAVGYGPGSVREQVDRVLATFIPDDLTSAELESYFFHRAASVDDDADEAHRRTQAALKLHPSSSRVRLLMARRHEDEGEIDRLFETLDAGDWSDPNGAIVAAHFAYLWDDYDRGIVYLRPAMQFLLEQARRKDPGRSLPAFGATAWSAACLGNLTGSFAPIEQWYAELRSALGDDLDDAILTWIRAKRDGTDLRELASRANESLAFSDGAVPLQAAVLQAQLDADPASAMRRLGAVKVPAHRHDLEAVRLLAHAHHCARAEDLDRHRQQLELFIERMPMLLAPEMAAFFDLLEPMEAAKELYRTRRLA